MPHCQKETFNRATKSKKERLKSKQDAASRKQKLATAKAATELDDKVGVNGNSNNIAPVEGYGEYEIGCEPEPEYHKFNVKKRNKKHLRLDLKKAKAREEKEEEERSKKKKQEDYEKQEEKLAVKKAAQQGEEEEEEQTRPQFEYFVFICECCDRRYATKNQFLNHTNSKNHLRRCRLYEELGLIVTHIELRGEYNNEQETYNDDDDDDEIDNDNDNDNCNEKSDNVEDEDRDVFNNNNAVNNRGVTKNVDCEELEQEQDEIEEEHESDEEYFPPRKRTNMFAGFSDNSSDSNSSSDDDDDNDKDNRQFLPLTSANKLKDPPPSSIQDDDDEDNIYFDELIYQNQLIQDEINAEGGRRGGGETIGIIPSLPEAEAEAIITPIPFNDNYDPTQYDINENRLAIVQHRLRKNLAAKGIEPKSTKNEQQQQQHGNNNSNYYDPLEAITMGTTLLQQVLEANVDQLQQKLDAYNKHKAECALLGRQFALSKGNSKAIPSQYIFQKNAADNTRQRANVHHAGSHYHMQMSRSMQFGRSKGLMARHSSQGSRLQASRMTAAVVKSERTATRKQSSSGNGGGKTSNKSNQKRQGRAGGSKKTGGNKESGTGGN